MLKSIRVLVLSVAFLPIVPAALAATKTVQVMNFSFGPADLTIAPGDTVIWMWVSGFHSSTSDLQSGSPEIWDSGDAEASFTYSHTFNTPGAYSYYCRIHSTPGGHSMNGVIRVVSTVTPPSISSLTPSSGPVAGGTSVAIAGSGFQSGASVSFGGVAASSSVASATRIDATTPAHSAGTVSVVVTNPDGGSATFTGFSYVVASPVLAGFIPSSGIQGVSVTIRGSGFSGATAVRFGGVATTFAVIDDSQIIAAVPAGAATGSISITTPAGTATSSVSFTIARPKRTHAARR